MKPIIEVRDIWKSYKIGGKKENYLSLRDSLMNIGQSLLGQKKETFWALQDINFDVMPGECIGIIGRNGAGKSTLLKILSQITPPTKGHIKMRGRVASLLEVGTGFHPELTGRENIYLNGSILGMHRQEINQSFDEIVNFSGVEKFLDTPLKHYSSGMRLRLAFSVAAHLNPEILLIDEVLAVGDAEFQKKCLGKMDEVSKSGRTVVFVSHDLEAVERLCKNSVLLNYGKIKMIESTDSIISLYTKNNIINQEVDKNYKITLISNKTILDEEESLMLNLSVQVYSNEIIKELKILFYSEGIRIGIIDLRNKIPKKQKKQLDFTIKIEKLPLVSRLYNLGTYISSNKITNDFFNLLTLKVRPIDKNSFYTPKSRGLFMIEHKTELL